MTISITVRLTDEQFAKIQKSGLNTSEYTRQAVEYYSENKMNATILSKVNVVDECIKLLKGYRDELKNRVISEAYQNLQLSYKIEEDVRQGDENLSYKTGDSVSKSYKNKENVRQVVRQNKEGLSNKNDDFVRRIEDDFMYDTYKQYFGTMSNMLNNLNQITPDFKKKITQETNTKLSDLDAFLFEYRDDIKNMEGSIASERVRVDYEDGKKL